MAAVQQRVLNWLYSVLTSEYQDVNRTYSDVAQALSHYSSLTPRTEVYTYEDGVSALLVQLSGTIPVQFRGNTYRFPISIWIPHAYPRESPMVYVTPTEGMVVRAGQHVDPQGKVYHPYLVGWTEFWDKSSVLDFLAILRDVFAKEPPVVTRQQRNPPPISPQPTSIPPPVPPLPPDIARPSSQSPAEFRPPPPPPKPYESAAGQAQPSQRQSGPPVPPLPPEANRPSLHQQPPPQVLQGSSHQPRQPQPSNLRYESPAPLPQPPPQQQFRQSRHGPPNPPGSYAPQQNDQISHPTYSPSPSTKNVPYGESQLPPSYIPSQPHQQPRPPADLPDGSFRQRHQSHEPHRPSSLQYGSPLPLQQPQVPQLTKPKPAPPTDLLDRPVTLPTGTQPPVAPPPIPPNPEKDLLLHNLALTLYNQRQQHVTRTSDLLPSLSSQHNAMLNAMSNMRAEHDALSSLSALLTSNTTILHNALHAADAVIENSQHRAAPGVDEILVAPTVVGNQLYELVCEERSLADALFMLGRAVERGRVAPAVFVKVTRSLAREWFLKKALVRKVGRGMGLADVDGGGLDRDGWYE